MDQTHILDEMTTNARVLTWLGRDHSDYGSYSFAQPATDIACAISVGRDKSSPSLEWKGEDAHPNEDALFVVDAGSHVIFGVGDSHCGNAASHLLTERLAQHFSDNIDAVVHAADPRELVAQIFDEYAARIPELCPGETSLVLTVYDRAQRSGIALSFADSTLTILRNGVDPILVNRHNHTFVSFEEPTNFAAEHRSWSQFSTVPGDTLVAYTDGIDECHYRSPETSVTLAHMAAVHASSSDSEEFLRALVELALSGTEGNPGGQDNIAAVALRVV